MAHAMRYAGGSRWPICRAREAMEFDVVIVGAGPAGLAAAIRLKQLNAGHLASSWWRKAPRSAPISSRAR